MKKVLLLSAAASMVAACGGPNLNCDDSGFKENVVDHYNRTVLESIKKSLISDAEGVLPNPAESVSKEVIEKISSIKLSDVRLVSKNDQTNEAVCSANYTVTVDGQEFKNPIRYRLEYLLDLKKTNVQVFNEGATAVSITIANAISKYSNPFRSANTDVRRQRENERIGEFQAIENLYVDASKSSETTYDRCVDKVDSAEARNRCDKEQVENKFKIYREMIGALPSKFEQCVHMRAFALYMENEGKSRRDQKPLLSSDINQWKEECKRSS